MTRSARSAAAILAVDLSGQTQVELDFWWRRVWHDENHVGRRRLHQRRQWPAIWWLRILSFNDGPESRGEHQVIDLDEAVSGATA